MPRRPRLELPGLSLHITHRGVNRGGVFIDDDDRRHYLQLLKRAVTEYAIAVHAYVLMDNHVHLLTTAAGVGMTSAALRWLSQSYVQAFNRRHGRTGTLWEGRFKSCLVDSDRYVLSVYRYIELNPVRAAMVGAPEHHAWSSVHANLCLRADPVVTPHPSFLAIGAEPQSRALAYQAWLHEGVDDQQLNAIRAHIAQERALGNPRFQAMVEKTLNRPVTVRPRGRPSRSPAID